MSDRDALHARIAMTLALALVLGACAARRGAADSGPRQENVMSTHQVRGEFDVNMRPQNDDGVSDAAIGRFGLDKAYHGALEATSKGQMLAYRSGVKGSAGYVAMERVVGVLEGRRGSFVMQHDGTMQGGALHLNIVVVPDSGTEELQGLRGTMKIEIEGGKHFYVLEYALP